MPPTSHSSLRKAFLTALLSAGAAAMLLPMVFLLPRARAAAPPYDKVAPYDLATLGMPKFINTSYIDIAEVTQLTKFRSNSGHDYSDQLEFGSEGTTDSNGKVESCRSMKHYFYGIDKGTPLYAPVSGTITQVSSNSLSGATDSKIDVQIGIQPDSQPAFGINIFHITGDQPFTVGQHVTEGQKLGIHPGSPYVASDIAVFVKTTTGFHLVSYFEALTDEAFAPWQARGVHAASDLIYSAETRDAAPYHCSGLTFVNVTSDPSLDYVTLTGGAATQILTLDYSTLPYVMRTTDAPSVISATSSAGLPVSLTTTTPNICTASGFSLTGVSSGTCQYQITQPGVLDQFHAATYQLTTTVIAGMNASPIYSSAQANKISFLRFYNTGTTAGTVTATLFDGASGKALTQWTSPQIPAGSEQQYPINTLEQGLAGTQLPQTYSLLVQTKMSGLFQHVLLQTDIGAFSNHTTCAFGNGSDAFSLSGVHSSTIGNLGYPSTIIVSNTGDPTAVTLDIYDARNGNVLGSYTTDEIPANGRIVMTVSALEAAAHVVPTADIQHYVIKTKFQFSGFLQHLVMNQKTGITVDMTAQCTLDGNQPTAASGQTQVSFVFSSKNATQRSYLRIGNLYSSVDKVTVVLHDYATGKTLGSWTSPSIPYYTAQQFAISDMESALPSGTTIPVYYALTFSGGFSGYLQHVVWNTANGTLTNLTRCTAGITSSAALEVPFVHSSLFADYPSTVYLNSIESQPSSWFFGFRDIRTGGYVSSNGYTVGGSLALASDVSVAINVATWEKTLQGPFKPTAGMDYYVTEPQMEDASGHPVSGGGYVQHLVTNLQSGLIANMTATCPLY